MATRPVPKRKPARDEGRGGIGRALASLLRLAVLLPVAIVAIVLALANRGPATLVLDPFGASLAFEAPLFVLLLGALMLGVLMGGLAGWLSGAGDRKAARRLKRRVAALEAEAAAAAPAPPVPPAPPSPGLPVPMPGRLPAPLALR